jgi:hypothetical protein
VSHHPTAGCKAFESVYRTESLSLGVYRCEHRNVDRGAEQLADVYSLNIPTRGVYRKHCAKGDSIVDPQRCVWFDRGMTYQTSHPQGFGDAGLFVTMRREVAGALIAEFDRDAAAADRIGFPFADGPLGARALLAARRLFHDASSGSRANCCAVRSSNADRRATGANARRRNPTAAIWRMPPPRFSPPVRNNHSRSLGSRVNSRLRRSISRGCSTPRCA